MKYSEKLYHRAQMCAVLAFFALAAGTGIGAATFCAWAEGAFLPSLAGCLGAMACFVLFLAKVAGTIRFFLAADLAERNEWYHSVRPRL